MKHARADYDTIQDASGRIPADEPVFLVRGQDRCGAATVRAWADFVEGLGADPEIVRVAREHAKRMLAWPKKKLPDLAASPASQPATKPSDAEQAAWLADKIVALGDYAKEAAEMLRRWPQSAPVHQPLPVATEDERERILDRLALACHERGVAIQRQDVDRAGQWLTVIDDCRAALAAHHPHREDERKATDAGVTPTRKVCASPCMEGMREPNGKWTGPCSCYPAAGVPASHEGKPE
jgi:hypothetical protein